MLASFFSRGASRFNWSKIHLIYFALAGFDLLAIGTGLGLSEWSKLEHEKTVAALEQASALRENMRDMQTYTIKLGTVANDLMLSRDVQKAREDIQLAAPAHERVFSNRALAQKVAKAAHMNLTSQLAKDLQNTATIENALNQLDPAIVRRYAELRKAASAAAGKIIDYAQRAISAFAAGDEARAAQHLRTADAALRDSMSRGLMASADLDAAMAKLVSDSEATFERATFLQYLIGGGIFCMILLACAYAFFVGRILQRKYGELEQANSDAQAFAALVDQSNSELRLSLEQLREAQSELVRKGRMEQLGQLTATVAHELRNPLGSVRTSAFLMKRKLEGQSLGLDAQIQRIENGIARCDTIIGQLLDFSRSKKIECVPGDLDGWLEQVLTEEARKMDASIALTCELGLGHAQVPFDPSRLQRAVINLLSNAVEALTQAKSASPHIHIATAPHGDAVELMVRDNGPGMSEEVLAKIREPLFTTKSFGTGLGVPAIEQIAIQHGGKLDVVSLPGHGATFTITLPLPVVEQQAAA